MNLHEARHLAKELMAQHSLSEWSFRFDHARRRFGSCQPTRRVISLSKPLTLLNSLDQVRDTLLHEIAHALTPGDHHGAKWKAKCREIGAKPVRCFTGDEVIAPPRREARYQLGCPACDWWVDRHKLSSRAMSCRTCRGKVIHRERATGKQFVIKVAIEGRYRIRRLVPVN